MTHIALIPGHGNRSRNGAWRWDPGATSDMGQEADIVRAVAARVLELGGDRVSVHDSDRDGPWTYTSRRNSAHSAISADPGHWGVVCHVHVNAGGGDYILGMYDPRSTTGAGLAGSWCSTVADMFDGRWRGRCIAATRPTWDHAANLIEPSYSVTPPGVAAVLLELGFIDNPTHRDLLTGDAIDVHARAILDAWK